jgi:peptide/nickel transport system permease protein
VSVVAQPPAAAPQPAPAAAPARSRRNPLAGIGFLGYLSLVIIVVAALIAIFGSILAPFDPNQVNLSSAYVGSTGSHLLGFDGNGRDLFSRLLVGARTSLIGPLAVVAFSIVAGVGIAIATAWKGGRFDTISSTGLDILFAFPGILLAVLAAAVFGAGLTAAALALGVAYMPYVARVVRSGALRERNQPYIAALEVQGFSGFFICLRHLVPNVAGLIVAQGTILFGYAMVDLAAISFIGLGVQTPQADWGVMVSEGQTGVLQGYPAESLAAGLCIVLVVVAFNILGERLIERSQRSDR